MRRHSIRTTLLAWLLLPLFGLSCLGFIVAYNLSVVLSNQIYDEILLNSADSVLARIDYKSGKLKVDLPPAAEALIRHSDKDQFFYKISDSNGHFIYGNANIPEPKPTAALSQPKFCSRKQINGHPVRIVKLTTPLPGSNDILIVQCAETLNARRELVYKFLLAIVSLQLLSMICAGLAIYFGVKKSFAPLRLIQQLLTKRGARDLTPLNAEHAPVEVYALVETINHLFNELQSYIDFQQQFVANAAHQLRTPLAGIKTYVDIGLKQTSTNDGARKDVLTNINRGVRRMSHLIRQLLLLARSEQITLKQQIRDCVDLNSVASEATFELTDRAIALGIDLEFEPSAKPATITGDEHSLVEMTKNLVENAVLYTPKGGRVKVTVASGSETQLIVDDSGIGIPEKERSLVFERFYRISGNNTEGSGLGLAIVKEIVEAHNGKISIEPTISSIGTRIIAAFRSERTAAGA
jgi:two-component system sensor histidine kinase TctE